MLAVGWILHGFGEAVKEWARPEGNVGPSLSHVTAQPFQEDEYLSSTGSDEL